MDNTSRKDTWGSQNELEGALDVMLGSLMDTGEVVDVDHLLRARNYPDFWAKDKLDREFLIECKNAVPGKVASPRHFQDNGRWTEEYLWTERNILSKAWLLPAYETQPQSGDKHGKWVQVRTPFPVLVTRHVNFDLPSLKALYQLFGHERIICFGDKDPAIARWAFLSERLRLLFTQKGLQ